MRGGRKTRCAVSFCKRLMEGYFRGTPRHVVLITSVIFVRETEEEDGERHDVLGIRYGSGQGGIDAGEAPEHHQQLEEERGVSRPETRILKISSIDGL
jgi:hypothetical protein